jgi:hypothetical protein
MKKIVWVFIIMLAGCASSLPERDRSMSWLIPQREALTKIDQLRVGMREESALTLMGDHLVVGYERQGDGTFNQVTIPQPHEIRHHTQANSEYTVHYYVTHIQKPDGMISREELTPVVFGDQGLVGIGYEFLENLGFQ